MIGFIIVVVILAWAVWGLQVLELNQAVSKSVATWLDEPGNNVRLTVAITSLLVAIVALSSDSNSFLGQFKGDMLSIAITVVVLDELSSYRSRLERKQDIIDQIESSVRDAAVEAVRLARKSGFIDEAVKKARLSGVNFDGVDLSWVNLDGVDLCGVSLEGANLLGANLKDANLAGANLIGAKLVVAHLERANLVKAHLTESDLGSAFLEEADLRWVYLEEANLSGAILDGANMSGAHLEGAYLMAVDLSWACLDEAIYNEKTRWADGFDPVAAGAILVDDPIEWIDVKHC